jgi:hypothetical protein
VVVWTVHIGHRTGDLELYFYLILFIFYFMLMGSGVLYWRDN